MTPEHLRTSAKDQLDLVLSFFARVESKLSVLLAIATGMLAVLGTNSPPWKDLSVPMLIAVGLAAGFICASMVFLYRGAFPSLQGGASSLVYFRQIAARSEDTFIEDFKKQTDEDRINDILGQAWRNSEILKVKFDCLKLAFIFLAVAIAPWLVSLMLFAAYNSSTHSILFKCP